jgi:outer membrane protein TolC
MAEFLPTFSASLSYGGSGEDPAHPEKVYSFGVQVSAPLFEGGLREARVREATSRVRESEALLKDAERKMGAHILQARQSVQEAILLLRARTEEASLTSKALALARSRFEKGMESSLEVVDAHANDFSAQDRTDEALAIYQLAQIHLAHALGNITDLIE